MKIVFFSSKSYDRDSFRGVESPHTLVFHEAQLNARTARLAEGAQAVCAFVNDDVNRDALTILAKLGVELVLLRSAGFNNVDLQAAQELNLTVARVPAYSPHAVAEHTFGLILSLNRHLHKAYARVREGDFRLAGLLGFDIRRRTMGIIGTGLIGECVARIAHGFGCRILLHDVRPNENCLALGCEYVERNQLLAESDIVSLHCPLLPSTYHLINDETLALMKPDAMLINTSRGGIIDTEAVIRALKAGRIGSLGIDVYEEEAALFFEDLSAEVINDDVFARLLTFPNVLITGHQGFFTADALQQIATTTLANACEYEASTECSNAVTYVAT